MKRFIMPCAAAAALVLFAGVAMAHDGPQFVRVTIDYQVQDTSGADPHGLKHLSPGVWVLIAADAKNPLFTAGEDAGAALEMLAEVGNNDGLAAVAAEADVIGSGVFGGTPHKATGSRSFTLLAPRSGGKLYFATMVAGSNDWFLAPASGGITLFDGGNLNTGPFDLMVWDAGTEKDLNEAGDDLNTAEFGPGMDMDNSNDAADPDTMIRHADQMMKGLTGTASLALVD
jgi:hypothetical protein